VYLRGHTYYIDISINGERIRRSAGKTLQGALTLLARLESTGDEAPKRPSTRTTYLKAIFRLASDEDLIDDPLDLTRSCGHLEAVV
jgi:hypothetical protein